MPTTYEAIATVTVGSGGASSISFSSIPATYTDLSLFFSVRADNAAGTNNIVVAFNGSTSNTSTRRLYGVSNGTFSDSLSQAQVGNIPAANATASTFSNCVLYIPNYTSTNAKSSSQDGVAENNGSTNFGLGLYANLWNPSTQAAITSLTFTTESAANFVQHSTATLYGIKNS